MKRRIPLITALGLLALFVTLALAETLVVKVQSTNLRKTPKFYGAVVQALKSGDKVEKVAGQPDGWFQVKTAGGAVGWVHSSAVSVQKFSLTAVNAPLKTQASADEVALAGKGFNKQVEESFRAKNTEANFAEVDRLQQLKVGPAALEQFLKQGRLGDFRGGK
jgi:uncharacterized protein YgiM (DUF1202 family)